MLATDVVGDMILVLVVSWLAAATARRLRQPAVVGQILSGIATGPSLLGRLPGHLTARLFPAVAAPALAAKPAPVTGGLP